MVRVPLEIDELVDHWTVLADERELIAGKRGATRLGFVLLLKFYVQYGRFPRGRAELPDEAVRFVADQVKVPASELGFYEWSGSTIEFHRSQVRAHTGFRECTVADAEKLTAWLGEHVAQAERRPDLVREELLGRCREERIEPPARTRIERIVASALHQGEETLFLRVSSRLSPAVAARLEALIAADGDVEQDEEPAGLGDRSSVLASIKADPGNVSLESMLTEIAKLEAVRTVGLPVGLLADVAPKVAAGWRARAAVESPSHMRGHPQPTRLVLLAALLHAREAEITDALVDLVIATVHRIGARAQKKVTDELINAFKRVTGKEHILFRVAEAVLAEPDGTVREVVYPAVDGGEATLRELQHEFRTNGPTYRRTVAITLKASYTNHYRRGMIRLLGVLAFASSNATHRPVIEALEVIARHAGTAGTTYYPLGASIPAHRGLTGDFHELVYRTDARGRARVVRTAYEVATFQALREALRCKEICR